MVVSAITETIKASNVTEFAADFASTSLGASLDSSESEMAASSAALFETGF